MGEIKETEQNREGIAQSQENLGKEAGLKQDPKNTGGLGAYKEPLLLLLCVTIGAVLGLVFREKVAFLKPVGQIFLNLLFTLLVPLIFFSISASIANVSDTNKVGKLLFYLILIFVSTAAIAAVLMFTVVHFVGLDTQLNLLSEYGKPDCRYVYSCRLSAGHQPSAYFALNHFFYLHRNGSVLDGKRRRVCSEFSQPMVQGIL